MKQLDQFKRRLLEEMICRWHHEKHEEGSKTTKAALLMREATEHATEAQRIRNAVFKDWGIDLPATSSALKLVRSDEHSSGER